MDNIDVKAATKKGIMVCNVPAGNTISACEHTFGLILSLLRNIPQAHNALKEGRWDRKKYKGKELYGKKLGIVGMGRIGTEVALRAKAFNMDILVSGPYITQERVSDIGVQILSFDELLKESGIVTLHLPVNDKTRGLFDKKTISKMKKTHIL
ncbi:MAG: NAD(P)-dependent oxidoreductase [Elusimicrobiota bacterium]|nr:NAD(P)-dependent oxidoreductase [Elusimicrobiota bacterium]